MTTTMTRQVLKVNRDKLAACMTCPLCQNLFRDATTVSECLHTFCRKCIYDKITEEDLENCPVCNIQLGCAPLEKLRADHNLQDLRSKIFPSKRCDSGAPKTVSSVPLPPRRKERSLSSLVTGKPKVPAKSNLIGRRSKLGPRKNPALQVSTFPVKESVKDVEAHQASLSSPQTFSRISQNRRQEKIPVAAEPSQQQISDDEDVVEIVPLEGKPGMWKPVKSQVKAASKTKSDKSNSRGTVSKPVVPDARNNEIAKPAVPDAHDNEVAIPAVADARDNEIAKPAVLDARYNEIAKSAVPDAHDNEIAKPAVPDARNNETRRKTRVTADAGDNERRSKARVTAEAGENETRLGARVKEVGNASKVHGEENKAIPAPSGSLRPRRYQGRQKRAAVSEGWSALSQSVIDNNNKSDERFSPIWFSLVASADQKGDAPLPQILSSYIRIKDGSLPVSFIQKYIVKKLNLISEAEVEISLMGQPLFSTLRLHDVVNWYVKTISTPEKIQTTIGSSAKDFVMVLTYARKAPPPRTYLRNAYSRRLQQ